MKTPCFREASCIDGLASACRVAAINQSHKKMFNSLWPIKHNHEIHMLLWWGHKIYTGIPFSLSAFIFFPANTSVSGSYLTLACNIISLILD